MNPLRRLGKELQELERDPPPGTHFLSYLTDSSPLSLVSYVLGVACWPKDDDLFVFRSCRRQFSHFTEFRSRHCRASRNPV